MALKRLIAVLLGMLFLAGSCLPVEAIESYNIYCNVVKMTVGSKTAYVNGVPIYMDTAPYIKSGRTFLPIRYAAENLNAAVTWDGFTGRTDVETDDGQIVEFLAGDKNIYLGDLNHRTDTNANAGWVKKVIDVPPVVKKKRMHVPVRFMAEAIGCSVKYDQRTKSITIRRIDTKDWLTYVEPYTGTKIKFPYDWNIETSGFYLEIFKNTTTFKFSYNDSSPRDVIKNNKELLLKRGWKVVSETGTYLKLTKRYDKKQQTAIVSTRKSGNGSLVFEVTTDSTAPEWDLLIIDKITPGSGI